MHTAPSDRMAQGRFNQIRIDLVVSCLLEILVSLVLTDFSNHENASWLAGWLAGFAGSGPMFCYIYIYIYIYYTYIYIYRYNWSVAG